MTKAELKARLYEAIDRRADDIIAIGERIRRQHELGFKEVKTSRFVKETLRGLGLEHRALRRPEGLDGSCAWIKVPPRE